MASSSYIGGISPWQHNVMGVVLSVEGLFGIAATGFLLFSLFTRKDRDPTLHTFRISLAIADLAIGFMCPVVAIASFSKEWPYGTGMCQTYAFVANFFGLISIWSLTAMVLYRYQIAKAGTKKEDLTGRYFMILTAIWGGAFFWAAAPLPNIGWGRYTIEPFGTGCLLDFGDRDFGYFVYLIGFSVLGLCMPIAFLIVRGLNHEGVSGEIVTTCWKAVLVLCFYWGTYGLVAVASLLGGAAAVPVWLYAVAPILAKTCPMINPLLFGEISSSHGPTAAKEQKKH